MHERLKAREAEYFLNRMGAERHDPRTFRFEFSAFLSAARSVLQYALRESQDNGMQAWYDSAVAADQMVSYFKGIRDDNIHSNPVAPSTIAILVKKDLFVNDDEMIPYQHMTTEYKHSLTMNGIEEDALQLCREYLSVIQKIVEDGVGHNAISG